ncbi:MAG: imidazoleglycerol-phosphate dehydratase [Sarcosagium campestre]|nr:MAG: imidazoleglycerol-phosphate dehydratase [Sarcosagium campestre]
MSLSILPALDNLSIHDPKQGLTLSQISYLGGVFARVTSQDLEDAFTFLHHVNSTYGAQFAVHLDVGSLPSSDDVVSLLDAGAAKIFVSIDQLKSLEAQRFPDMDRIAMCIPKKEKLQFSKTDAIDAIGDTTVGIFCDENNPALVEAWLKELGTDRPPVYFTQQHAGEIDLATCLGLIKLSATAILPASQLTFDQAASPTLTPVHELFNITSDRPDGLFTTLVVDERGVALGLVYSNRESLKESLRTGRGVYHSRKRGLWYKGESSGDVQELVRIQLDCDNDCLRYTVRQKGTGFCHLGNATCFGQYSGLSRLQQTISRRKSTAPEGSYTSRLFDSPSLLRAKIMEEAEELCEATEKKNIAFEAADLLYFALVKCVGAGVSLEDVERNLDAKSIKVKRRKGDAKGPWAEKEGLLNGTENSVTADTERKATEPADESRANGDKGRIHMKRYITAETSPKVLDAALQRPSQRSTDSIMGIVKPIIESVRTQGDVSLLGYTHKFEKATSLTSVVLRAPFPEAMMQLPPETVEAIDISFDNIYHFHLAQKENKPLSVETMPGVVCSRFSRPIERVGLYVPGGTAVLPSTALMLGVPALVAGCKKIVLASPPRSDGSITPEIVYVAHKVGAESIVLAGGAQAVAALAYGTESVPKVDKILGPGNQFVTAAKMLVSNDTSAGVSIDMPAGPSEILVVADSTANPAFVASDLLSQAEHGVDSQVILIAVALTEPQLAAIEEELHTQASLLPRVAIVREAISHSVTLVVKSVEDAMALSNQYAPEHLILQLENAVEVIKLVENAGSVFLGHWTPESVGDYSAGVNHSLPTYGYAKQYSGVNLGSYVKHITSSNLTEQGLRNVGGAVMQMAKVEELEAHRRAVEIRLQAMT